MSKDDVDAELLALADDDSASEAEEIKAASTNGKSPSPARSPLHSHLHSAARSPHSPSARSRSPVSHLAQSQAQSAAQSPAHSPTTSPAQAPAPAQSPDQLLPKSPEQSPAHSPNQILSNPPLPRPPKGVAQRISTKASRPATAKRQSRDTLNEERETKRRRNDNSTEKGEAKRRRKDDSAEEGEASSGATSPDSLGSGAMSESDSDAPVGGAAAGIDDSVVFPIDGIFRSEKEKASINAMPEIERERLLAERAEEADKLAQSAQLRKIMQARANDTVVQKKRKAPADVEESPPKSSTKTKQSENLAAYKRQREQRHEERLRGYDRKARDKTSPSLENGASDAEGDAEKSVEWDDKAAKAPATRDEPPPTLRDYQRVSVGRSNFAKVCFWPGFEETIKGCFVRVAIGINKATGDNTYRMTQIKGFVQGRPYVMEGPNGRHFHTDQYALLAHGKAEKEWPFIACSDSRISEAEFDRWNTTMVVDGLRNPKLPFLASKCNEIQQLLDRRWTEEEITEKLRRANAVHAMAAAHERERLERQKKVAVANANDAEIARLDQELAAFDASNGHSITKNPYAPPKPAKAPTQQDRLAAINRANRRTNTEEIRKAQIEEKRRERMQREAMLRGEAVANPFARVKTRAKVHHDDSGKDSLKVPIKKSDDLFGEGSDISRVASPTLGAAISGVSTPASEVTSKGGVGGLRKKKLTDDEVLAAMDFGIEIDF